MLLRLPLYVPLKTRASLSRFLPAAPRTLSCHQALQLCLDRIAGRAAAPYLGRPGLALEMDPPPASSGSGSASDASATMVIITVVGILAAFALLASYYAFVTKCQPLRALWSRQPPWHRRARGPGGGGGGREASVIRAGAAAGGDDRRGLGLPLIRMLPVVKFTAAACGGGGMAAPRISVSECAVCLSEFAERERVRLLPNCSHAFHIDCIDTWLQGSARCPFCRSDVSLPAARLPPGAAATAAAGRRRDDALAVAGDSIVIEVRGEHESWFSGHGGADAAAVAPGGGRRPRQQQTKPKLAESVGDEAIDTRRRNKAAADEAFAVQPLRRSLSLDSSCDKHLYVSVQELLLTTQRQACHPSVHS